MIDKPSGNEISKKKKKKKLSIQINKVVGVKPKSTELKKE